jgi:hypothetical protein
MNSQRFIDQRLLRRIQQLRLHAKIRNAFLWILHASSDPCKIDTNIQEKVFMHSLAKE